ncbi:MAG TPA: hypothetical protein VMD04_06375 [Candidatus Margulisiibacteriota bacterium]|nr:hypothetical protein [Candidatus Margulisiibacteriota bacterium]
MNSFAFVVNLSTIKQLKELSPAMKMLPDSFIKPFLKSHPDFKIFRVKKIRSIRAKEIEGYFILSLPPKDGLQENKDVTADKLISAAAIAEKLEARIIGIDGFIPLRKKLKLPLTTGIALACWSIFEAVYRATKARKADLKDLDLVIIGADSALGRLCARKFSEHVRQLVLIDTKDLPAAVNNSDIIIKLDGSHNGNLNIFELRPKAVICNYNCKEEKGYSRRDIAIINAGQIKLPFAEKLEVKTGLWANTVSAPLAETMLLTFEERFVNYSWDENTNLDKLEEIADIASRHGFEVWVPEAPVL